MSLFSKMLAKARYKRNMKEVTKNLISYKKLYEANQKRILELEGLIREGSK